MANKNDDTINSFTIDSCRISRMLWSKKNSHFDVFRLLLGALYDHMDYPGNDFCRSSLKEEEDSYTETFL